jgi:hypothetical protein
VDPEHRLPHEERSAVVAAHGDREERVQARRGGKHRFAEPPAAELGGALARAAHIAPEVVEVVARAARVERFIFALLGIPLQAARAEILDEDEAERASRRRKLGEPAAVRREVRPEPGEVAVAPPAFEQRRGRGETIRTRTCVPGARASSEFWIASRTSASARLPSASVEKNSPSIGSMFISPGCMRRKRQTGGELTATVWVGPAEACSS